MSYNARRAPNVSAYLANLNTIPSAQEVAAGQGDFALADDGLDFLTNAEFFDFDGGFDNVGAFPPAVAPPQVADVPTQKTGAAKAPQYQFSEFQTYPALTASPTSSMPSPSTLQGTYPPQAHGFPGAAPGDKRKASAAGLVSAADLEEASRFAAEEDKRRRNTAASARFRVKKKQREQALEKSTKDMTDKVSALESKVQQLEMENKWLKELITEKSKDGSDGKTIDERVAELEAGQQETAERSTEGRTDGVGTVEGLVKGEA